MNISSNKYDYNIHKLLYDKYTINNLHIVVHNYRTEHLFKKLILELQSIYVKHRFNNIQNARNSCPFLV